MATPPAPHLDDLLERRFSFYPPILGIVHNEFQLLQGTWSEILVRNTKSSEEVWIARRFFGEVSRIDEPVMIVGLNRELEYRSGTIWPTERKVLAMKGAGRPIGAAAKADAETPIPEMTGMGRITGSNQGGTEGGISKMIGIFLIAISLLTAIGWAVVHFTPKSRPTFTTKDQAYLELTREDDYFAIVRKLGQPKEDVWRPDSGELQYRRLTYPEREYSVILMGTDQPSARYIGTVSRNWEPLHYVEYSKGANTAAMLRTLKRF